MSDMALLSYINLNGTDYELADETARKDIVDINVKLENLNNEELEEHMKKIASDSVQGHTYLSDAVNSTLDVAGGTAATPKAVKMTYDLAATAKETADYAIAREDSTTTISADGLTITTTHADGTKTVTTMDTAGTSIIEEELDADLNTVAKYGTYIEGNTIIEKELSVV